MKFGRKVSHRSFQQPRQISTAQKCDTGNCWMCGDVIPVKAVVVVFTVRSERSSQMRMCQMHWDKLQKELSKQPALEEPTAS